MSPRMKAYAQVELPWTEPTLALARLADIPWAIGFVTGGEASQGACWSYVAAEPDATLTLRPIDEADPFAALADLAGPTMPADPAGPPFQGGVAGLLSYELADRLEHLGLSRLGRWPDLACARYPALLAFDHVGQRVLAVGDRKSVV